jgi:hypothetical protein
MKIDSRKGLKILLILALTFFMTSCGPANRKVDGPTASDILGNPGYPAISLWWVQAQYPGDGALGGGITRGYENTGGHGHQGVKDL